MPVARGGSIKWWVPFFVFLCHSAREEVKKQDHFQIRNRSSLFDGARGYRSRRLRETEASKLSSGFSDIVSEISL